MSSEFARGKVCWFQGKHIVQEKCAFVVVLLRFPSDSVCVCVVSFSCAKCTPFFLQICFFSFLRLVCTEPSAYNTNECVFECIKNLYDTEYCTSCDVGDKVTTIEFSSNQTLTPLMQHDLIFYNESTESIAAGNCLGRKFETMNYSTSYIILMYFFCCLSRSHSVR